MTQASHSPGGKRPVAGPVLFAITLAAVLVFFWWLLLYDHGVASG